MLPKHGARLGWRVIRRAGQVLELLRAVLAIALDVPTAGADPAHAGDSLLRGSLAAALAPSADASTGGPDLATPNPDPADARRAAWLAHYVAGTFLRRCLVR